MSDDNYDEGIESPLNETTSGSTGSTVRLMKTNELRREVDLPPLQSKREIIRQQREAMSVNGPTFDDALQNDTVGYGSAKEEEGDGEKIVFNASDSDDDNEGSTDELHDIPKRRPKPDALDNSQVRRGEATCNQLDGLLKLATNLAQGPREEVINLRKKNAELVHFIQSQGHSFDELNNHLRENNMIQAREVDDNGLFVIQKKRDHATMNLVFQEETEGRIQLNKQLLASNNDASSSSMGDHSSNQLPPVAPMLTWKDVACGGTKSMDKTTGVGATLRVSALDPRRLQLKPDAATGTGEQVSLSFKPTHATDMELNNEYQTAIAPPLEFLKNARDKWNTSLVGYFAGTSLPFEKTRAKLFTLWGNSGLLKVFYNPKGFYTMKFDTVLAKENVLKLGSVFIEGRVLFLKPWIEGTEFRRNIISTVPVWVKFVNIPQSYWCMEGLSYLASAVGVPVSLDKPTSNLEPMKFARICININATQKKPRQIRVPVLSDEDGTVVQTLVDVEYPVMPPSCSICQCFGHSLSKCTKNPENSATTATTLMMQHQKQGNDLVTKQKDQNRRNNFGPTVNKTVNPRKDGITETLTTTTKNPFEVLQGVVDQFELQTADLPSAERMPTTIHSSATDQATVNGNDKSLYQMDSEIVATEIIVTTNINHQTNHVISNAQKEDVAKDNIYVDLTRYDTELCKNANDTSNNNECVMTANDTMETSDEGGKLAIPAGGVEQPETSPTLPERKKKKDEDVDKLLERQSALEEPPGVIHEAVDTEMTTSEFKRITRSTNRKKKKKSGNKESPRLEDKPASKSNQ